MCVLAFSVFQFADTQAYIKVMAKLLVLQPLEVLNAPHVIACALVLLTVCVMADCSG